MLILAEGGLTTPWPKIRPAMRLGLSLATIGVAVSVAIVALGAHYLLGLRWQLAVLLGAVTSPDRRGRGVLGAAPGAAAAPADRGARGGVGPQRRPDRRAGHAGQHRAAPTTGCLDVRWASCSASSSLGVLVGLAVGFGGAWLMRRVALPSSGLYPLAVLSLTLLAYGGTAGLHALRVRRGLRRRAGPGQRRPAAPGRDAVVRRGCGLAGPDRAVRDARAAAHAEPDHAWTTVGIAVVAGLLLTFVARPVSVLVSSLVQPMPWRELAFVSWAGLRGAVPIVLATIPLAEEVTGAERLFDIVFVIVVIYTLLTGPTLPWVARRAAGDPALRAAGPRRRGRAAGADRGRPAAGDDQPGLAAARGRGRRAPAAAGRVGVAGGARRADDRARAAYRPAPRRRPAGGDPAQQREATEQRLRTVSPRGRLAQWLDERRTEPAIEPVPVVDLGGTAADRLVDA